MFVNALKKSDTFSIIKKDIDKNTLSHAYMIISPDDETIKDLFMLIACAVYCKKNICLECKDCNKVLHYNNADIKYINEIGQTIKVEDINSLIEDTHLKPFEDEKKLYFIYSADKMNTASQNKLLKTLEEPPKSVTIFLGVNKETAMLDTIKSRVRKISLDRFSENVIYNEILELTGSEEKAQTASVCSDGMLGVARKVAENDDYQNIFNDAIFILKNMKKSSDIASVLNIKALSVNRFPAFLDALSLIMRDMLLSKTNDDLILTKHLKGDIIALADEYSELALSKIIYLINDERKKLNFNVTNSSIVENLMFGMLEVKYRCR